MQTPLIILPHLTVPLGEDHLPQEERNNEVIPLAQTLLLKAGNPPGFPWTHLQATLRATNSSLVSEKVTSLKSVRLYSGGPPGTYHL